MKAAVFTEFGPPEVLHIAEAPQPVPGEREVLVRVHATTVNFGDTLVRNFKAVSPKMFHMPLLFWLIGRSQFGFRKPRTTVLGSEFAGEVVAIGADVTRYQVGDEVFGYRGPRMGAYAEYLCIPEDGVMALKPTNLTFEQAASVPYGAIMAWGLLRRVGLQAGQNILVNRASGGIGPPVVLAVAQFGARVTGVCGPSNVAYVQSLGADKVIDYTKEDFADRGETYDVIVDVLGKSSFAHCKRALAPNGRLVYVSFKAKQIGQMLWTSLTRRHKKVLCLLVNEKAEDLRTIKDFVEAGKLRPFVDQAFPLDQAAAAHRYADSDAKKGPVVITVP